MELKILFKNTIYLVATRVVKFVVGFIRAKLVAIFLGTLGAGIISQIDQLTQTLTQFTLLSMNDGLVKEIAESDKDDVIFKNRLAGFIKSYIIMISIICLVVFGLSIYFSKEITLYFLGNIKYYGYFLIGLASFPILVINSISFAILKSFKQIKYIARSELIVLIINIIIFIPFIYIWGLTGSVVYIVFSLFAILIANQYYAHKIVLSNISITLKDILVAKISSKSIKELFVFAGYGLTAGMAATVAEMVTRAIVVTQLGISQIGIYSPVLIWSSLFTGLILPSIGTYLYPRYCECKSDKELSAIINDSLRFVTLLMIPIILISIPIRYQIITLFYSKDFVKAGNYLPFHLLGTLFFLWMYIFVQAMKPTGRIKTEGIVTIIGCVIDLAIVYLLVSKIGLWGFMLKFLISPILIFVFYTIYWKNKIQFKIELKNILLMGYAVLSALLLILIEEYTVFNYKINFIIGLAILGAAFIVIDKSEKNYIMNKIKIRYKMA